VWRIKRIQKEYEGRRTILLFVYKYSHHIIIILNVCFVYREDTVKKKRILSFNSNFSELFSSTDLKVIIKFIL